jgi:hypothetical protein
MTKIGLTIAVVVALAGCDNSGANKPATKDKSDKHDSKAAADDPWAAPPPGASTKLGEKSGAKLAQIDTSKSAPAASAFTAKVDVAAIAQPEQPKLEIKGFGEVAASGFSVTYSASPNATHEQFRNVLATNHVFEQIAEGLNKTIRLPSAVAIQVVDCNTINAFYDPSTKRIIVCYELLDYFVDVFKPTAKDATELGNAVLGATMFSFFHEAGHGLIHLLDLPAVGREEDSVDQLATLTLIAGGDDGVGMALSGAYWFQLQAKAERKTPFWDEHGFDGQRFYNILCLIYGSNPDKYAAFVSSGTLPADRAKRCPEEYTKINKAWEKLLQPYLTNGAALNVAYKPPVTPVEAPTTTTDDPWSGKTAPPPVPAPAPRPVPRPEPPRPRPAPATHAITCEQVARKAAELVGIEAGQRARNMSPAEVEQVKARLQAQLPAVLQQILTECANKNWSDVSRRCVLNASDLATASKCR